jgi:hypothetical protein
MIDEHWPKLPDFCLEFNEKYGRTWCAPVPDIGLLGGAMFSMTDEVGMGREGRGGGADMGDDARI